jgi:hypothetical protein
MTAAPTNHNTPPAMTVVRTCPNCDYTAAYASAAQADAHHGRHSCTKHQHRAEVAQQRALRAQQGPIRPCEHPRAQHVHGTRTAYVKDRCRCVTCTAANAAAWALTHRARTFGQWEPFVEAAPVREYIGQLREAGIGVDQIAKLAGTSTSHIRELAGPTQLHKPPVQKVRPDTAQRILGIQPTAANRAPRSHLDARGTRRRVQALLALGWTHQLLAAELGRTATNLKRSLANNQVTAQTAGQISDLYQRLWDSRPPADTAKDRARNEATRTQARQQGWLPPLAWENIDTDPDPDPRDRHDPHDRHRDDHDYLDEIAIELAVAGQGIRLDRLTAAEQHEVVRQLTNRGSSIRDIAAQLATTTRTVSRRRKTASAA